MQALSLYLFVLIMFKFKPVANINVIRQQGDRNLRDDTGIVVFDIGIISSDVSYSAIHIFLLMKTRPCLTGAGDVLELVLVPIALKSDNFKLCAIS